LIKKIISGGQTGADQAALDVAIESGIPHGGWIPKGRKTENGVLPAKQIFTAYPEDVSGLRFYFLDCNVSTYLRLFIFEHS
jgi:hypothetical protein